MIDMSPEFKKQKDLERAMLDFMKDPRFTMAEKHAVYTAVLLAKFIVDTQEANAQNTTTENNNG